MLQRAGMAAPRGVEGSKAPGIAAFLSVSSPFAGRLNQRVVNRRTARQVVERVTKRRQKLLTREVTNQIATSWTIEDDDLTPCSRRFGSVVFKPDDSNKPSRTPGPVIPPRVGRHTLGPPRKPGNRSVFPYRFQYHVLSLDCHPPPSLLPC